MCSIFFYSINFSEPAGVFCSDQLSPVYNAWFSLPSFSQGSCFSFP